MKQITMMCPVKVVPADGPDGTVKALVFENIDCGEIISYAMESDLAEIVIRNLKKSNKALHLELVEAQARAEAQAKLGIDQNGGATHPGADAIVRDIVAGRQDPRRGQ